METLYLDEDTGSICITTLTESEDRVRLLFGAHNVETCRKELVGGDPRAILKFKDKMTVIVRCKEQYLIRELARLIGDDSV